MKSLAFVNTTLTHAILIDDNSIKKNMIFFHLNVLYILLDSRFCQKIGCQIYFSPSRQHLLGLETIED